MTSDFKGLKSGLSSSKIFPLAAGTTLFIILFFGLFRNCLNCDSLRWPHTHFTFHHRIASGARHLLLFKPVTVFFCKQCHICPLKVIALLISAGQVKSPRILLGSTLLQDQGGAAKATEFVLQKSDFWVQAPWHSLQVGKTVIYFCCDGTSLVATFIKMRTSEISETLGRRVLHQTVTMNGAVVKTIVSLIGMLRCVVWALRYSFRGSQQIDCSYCLCRLIHELDFFGLDDLIHWVDFFQQILDGLILILIAHLLNILLKRRIDLRGLRWWKNKRTFAAYQPWLQSSQTILRVNFPCEAVE